MKSFEVHTLDHCCTRHAIVAVVVVVAGGDFSNNWMTIQMQKDCSDVDA